MTSLFFSYSHKDEDLRDQLEVHLAMLKREGLIQTWHDRRIAAGSDLHCEINAKLNDADAILLLVSPDFLASDYCWGKEVSRAMARHEAQEASVIPVILRPCDWQRAPFAGLLAAPKDGKAITTWPNHDEAFLDVTRMIRAALGTRVHSTTPVDYDRHTTTAPAVVSDIRSSNLRISKNFTEADRDEFLHEAFDYIRKFFSGSLDSLKERNASISGGVRQIDANRFTAAAYRDGRKEAACTVWIGGDWFTSSGIRYFNDDSGATGSMTEELSIGSDDQIIFLNALMTGFRSGRRDQKLTMQGAAEYLWGMFVEPLQRGRPSR